VSESEEQEVQHYRRRDGDGEPTPAAFLGRAAGQ
jgi:hypothetical protein